MRLTESWKTQAALTVVTLLVVGAAAYLYRRPVVSTLSLGVFPAAVWLGVFLWAISLRRQWFRHVSLWIASIPLLALALGVMAFFEPASGPLVGLTLDGETSLGGTVGTFVIGSADWPGVLRLGSIALLGAGLAFPRVSSRLIRRLGRYVGPELNSLASNGKRWAVLKTSALTSDSSRLIRRLGRYVGPELNSLMSSGRRWAALNTKALTSEITKRYGRGRAAARRTDDVGQQAPAAPPIESADNDAQTVGARVTSADNRAARVIEPSVAADGREARVARAHASLSDGPASVAPAATSPETAEWETPPLDLLEDVPAAKVSEEEMAEKAESIGRTFAEYSVEVEVVKTWPGPTVTIYGLTPGWNKRIKRVRAKDTDGRPKLNESGKPVMVDEEEKTRVKVESILSRERDLALALGTSSIRIETPVMGEPLIGIELPNSTPSVVGLRSVMEGDHFQQLRQKAQLPAVLGKGTGGDDVVIDLAEMPHLLIAGATGSGKSVCINTIISCLIMEKTPAQLRMIMVDPKRVELTPYNGIPHLQVPVVVETDKVPALLEETIAEMMRRYRRLEDAGVRNIEAYNEKQKKKMPLLVVAIDELADLMMTSGKEVEASLCRLAQLGRATGIHLIVATQRPSVDVVTGLIKANFPSRISFGVASQVDSRTVLDVGGAEKLLGKGDMLSMPAEARKPTRVQGAFISDSEVDKVVKYWQAAARSQPELRTSGT